jgi:hypothetical protein
MLRCGRPVADAGRVTDANADADAEPVAVRIADAQPESFGKPVAFAFVSAFRPVELRKRPALHRPGFDIRRCGSGGNDLERGPERHRQPDRVEYRCRIQLCVLWDHKQPMCR